MDFLQVLSSPGFYAAIVGVALLCYVSTRDYLGKGSSVVIIMNLLIGLSMFKKLIVLLVSVPYASSFCSDWNCQYIKPVVLRGGINKYAWSKVLVCGLSAFCVALFGMLLFAATLALRFPFYVPDENKPFLYETLLSGPFPLAYLLVIICIFSLAAALWAVTGLACSAYIPNRFVAICTPLVFSYVLEEFTAIFPKYLNIYYLTRGEDVIGQGPLLTFFYTVGVFLVLIVLVGLLFRRTVMRRVRNEIV